MRVLWNALKIFWKKSRNEMTRRVEEEKREWRAVPGERLFFYYYKIMLGMHWEAL
jgi:hypothetical protein